MQMKAHGALTGGEKEIPATGGYSPKWTCALTAFQHRVSDVFGRRRLFLLLDGARAILTGAHAAGPHSASPSRYPKSGLDSE